MDEDGGFSGNGFSAVVNVLTIVSRRFGEELGRGGFFKNAASGNCEVRLLLTGLKI